jgi:hypothetical protein
LGHLHYYCKECGERLQREQQQRGVMVALRTLCADELGLGHKCCCPVTLFMDLGS